jgi:hypothetical protein
MWCLECASAAVTERPERTSQGYKRFRCRACGKQFDERSGRRRAEPGAVFLRRYRARGALAAALQARFPRSAGDVPGPEHGAQPWLSRGADQRARVGSETQLPPGRRAPPHEVAPILLSAPLWPVARTALRNSLSHQDFQQRIGTSVFCCGPETPASWYSQAMLITGHSDLMCLHRGIHGKFQNLHWKSMPCVQAIALSAHHLILPWQRIEHPVAGFGHHDLVLDHEAANTVYVVGCLVREHHVRLEHDGLVLR